MEIVRLTEADLPQKTVLYTKKNHVAILTLNRPEVRNAVNLQLARELRNCLDVAVHFDDDVRVVILTGADPAWCSGDDVKANFLALTGEKSFVEIKTEDKEWQLAALRGYEKGFLYTDGADHSFFEGSWGIPLRKKPIIAAVNGAVRGHAFSMCLSCDIRVVSERATFAAFMPRRGIAQLGMYPMLAPLVMGLGNALELALTSDAIDAQEAYRLGIANKVVPHEELMPATMAMAEKIAELPPVAIQLTKIAIFRNLNVRWQDELQWARLASKFFEEQPEHKEGAWDFVKKRGRDAVGADVGHVGTGKVYTGKSVKKGQKRK